MDILRLSFLLLLWVVVVVASASAAAASADDDSLPPPISSLQNDLEYDNELRLASHYLLFPDGCNDYYHYPNGANASSDLILAYAVTGNAKKELFSDHDGTNKNDDCPAVCIERGVHQSLVHAVMPDRYYMPKETTTMKNTKAFNDWFGSSCRQAEVCLLQYLSKDEALDVYWLSPNDNNKPPKFQLSLEYGERKTKCVSSFIGHSFQVQYHTSGEIIQRFTVQHTLVLPFGESPPSDDLGSRNITNEIETLLHTEWYRQGRIQRTFSSLGFAKGRLPNDVFASLGALYYNNRNHLTVEEWGGKGVFVNWWETTVAFVQIPWNLKAYYQTRLKDMVSEWAGVEVEETVMYGLRQYQEGARLLTHVDRHNTHAVSLIVNIAQGGLLDEEPWPVEVYDHGGRLHEIVMEPGDVVYYESAKNLHGRNRPLKGKGAYYVNLFTHYRPVGEGDDWWFNTDAVPKSPPVIEAIGKCHLDENLLATKSTLKEQLGQVKCDDPRLGSNISPTLATAKNANDLFDWWLYTSPPSDNKAEEKEEEAEL
eukprot:scaffold3416_cov120-Cylindrotheca_fusiformis.AAC.8